MVKTFDFKYPVDGTVYPDCHFRLSTYAEGNTRVEIVRKGQLGHECVIIVSTNVARIHGPGEVFIKDYTENAGMLRWMMENGFAEPPHDFSYSGYCKIPLCRLTPKFDEYATQF